MKRRDTRNGRVVDVLIPKDKSPPTPSVMVMFREALSPYDTPPHCEDEILSLIFWSSLTAPLFQLLAYAGSVGVIDLLEYLQRSSGTVDGLSWVPQFVQHGR
jgi:hypothetical protein